MGIIFFFILSPNLTNRGFFKGWFQCEIRSCTNELFILCVIKIPLPFVLWTGLSLIHHLKSLSHLEDMESKVAFIRDHGNIRTPEVSTLMGEVFPNLNFSLKVQILSLPSCILWFSCKPQIYIIHLPHSCLKPKSECSLLVSGCQGAHLWTLQEGLPSRCQPSFSLSKSQFKHLSHEEQEPSFSCPLGMSSRR